MELELRVNLDTLREYTGKAYEDEAELWSNIWAIVCLLLNSVADGTEEQKRLVNELYDIAAAFQDY